MFQSVESLRLFHFSESRKVFPNGFFFFRT